MQVNYKWITAFLVVALLVCSIWIVKIEWNNYKSDITSEITAKANVDLANTQYQNKIMFYPSNYNVNWTNKTFTLVKAISWEELCIGLYGGK